MPSRMEVKLYHEFWDGNTKVKKETIHFNFSLSGMQGFDMRIDENGDAEGNYTLLALQEVPPVPSNGFLVLNE